PKELAALKADPRFRYRCIVKNPNTGNRLSRTRPIFRGWGLDFSVQFDPRILSREDVILMAERLASDIGLSDDREKMGGRLEVAVVGAGAGARNGPARGRHAAAEVSA